MTTLIAIKGKDGIVVVADKQRTGIWMDEILKIRKITDNIYLLGAGIVSDVNFITRIIKNEIENFEIDRGRKIKPKEVANLLTLINYYGLRDFFPKLASFILAGFDDKDFYVYEITPDGVLDGSDLEHKRNYLTTGSGSIFAKPILDSGYNEDITVEKAKELATNALRAAIKNDPYSGIGYDMIIITKEKIIKESGPLNPYKVEERKEVEKIK